MRGDLLDVNIWLALSQPKHPQHALVQAYWQQTLAQFAQEHAEQDESSAVPSKLYFCRTSMLGLVRLLSQTAVVYGQPISLREAFASYERYRLMEEVGFLVEDAERVDAMLSAKLTSRHALTARVSTDVYLAALAQEMNLRLVTMDRDFKRFDLPNCLILGEEPATP